jgi:cytochrome c oxidase subunit 4
LAAAVCQQETPRGTMEEQHGHIGKLRTYVIIWILLLALTATTITVAGMHLGSFSTLAALAIASIKASLVLWFFMHLKYEKRFFKYLLLIPIATLTVIIGLTFLDIWYR